jgi:hypothetical protein
MIWSVDFSVLHQLKSMNIVTLVQKNLSLLKLLVFPSSCLQISLTKTWITNSGNKRKIINHNTRWFEALILEFFLNIRVWILLPWFSKLLLCWSWSSYLEVGPHQRKVPCFNIDSVNINRKITSFCRRRFKEIKK